MNIYIFFFQPIFLNNWTNFSSLQRGRIYIHHNLILLIITGKYLSLSRDILTVFIFFYIVSPWSQLIFLDWSRIPVCQELVHNYVHNYKPLLRPWCDSINTLLIYVWKCTEIYHLIYHLTLIYYFRSLLIPFLQCISIEQDFCK